MIKIDDLIPYLKDGWLAMDKDGRWWWYNYEPTLHRKGEFWDDVCSTGFLIDEDFLKDIAPAEDWEKSLIEIKDGKRV